MISLENLYLKGTKSRVSRKLKMRMARLLRSKLEKEEEIAKKVKRAYELRSEIIHGEKIPTIGDDLFLDIRPCK